MRTLCVRVEHDHSHGRRLTVTDAEVDAHSAAERRDGIALQTLQALAARFGGALRLDHAGRAASISLSLR
jgi:hypothetical protein